MPVISRKPYPEGMVWRAVRPGLRSGMRDRSRPLKDEGGRSLIASGTSCGGVGGFVAQRVWLARGEAVVGNGTRAEEPRR